MPEAGSPQAVTLDEVSHTNLSGGYCLAREAWEAYKPTLPEHKRLLARVEPTQETKDESNYAFALAKLQKHIELQVEIQSGAVRRMVQSQLEGLRSGTEKELLKLNSSIDTLELVRADTMAEIMALRAEMEQLQRQKGQVAFQTMPSIPESACKICIEALTVEHAALKAKLEQCIVAQKSSARDLQETLDRMNKSIVQLQHRILGDETNSLSIHRKFQKDNMDVLRLASFSLKQEVQEVCQDMTDLKQDLDNLIRRDVTKLRFEVATIEKNAGTRLDVLEKILGSRLAVLEAELQKFSGKGDAKLEHDASNTSCVDEIQSSHTCDNFVATKSGHTCDNVLVDQDLRIEEQQPSYVLKESVWDAMLFFGYQALGRTANIMLAFGLFVSLFLQVGMCLLIALWLADHKDYSKDSIPALQRWRSQTTAAIIARVCAEDGSLTTNHHQMHTAAAARLYLSGQLFPGGPVLCLTCVILWTMSFCHVAQEAVSFARAMLQLRQERVDSELRFTIHPSEQVRIKGVTRARSFFVILEAAIHLVMAAVLLITGTVWLVEITSVSGLLLGTVTLNFVSQIDKVVYSVFVPSNVKFLIRNMETLTVSKTPMLFIPQRIPLGALIIVLFTGTYAIITWFVLIKQHQAVAREVGSVVCG